MFTQATRGGVRSWATLVGAVAALVLGLAPGAGATATFTVDSAGDGGDSSLADNLCIDGTGHCTLRAAIQQANSTAGADQIQFDIAGAVVHTIALNSVLPAITGAVTITGYSQPGSSANTLATGDNAVVTVELTSKIPGLALVDAFTVRAAATIRGLVINRMPGPQIGVQTAGGSVIAGNFIGTDSTGALDPRAGTGTSAPGDRHQLVADEHD